MEKAQLICPKCHKYWADLSFKYDAQINGKDIKVVAGTKHRFKKGSSINCSLCGYEYTNVDVMLNIAEEHKNVRPGEEAPL